MKISLNPSSECPRFFRCEVNNCPLSLDYNKYLYKDDNDFELTCTMAKSIRVKIASNYGEFIKYGGLTAKEYAAKNKWEERTDGEKENIKSQLENARTRRGI